MVCWEPTGPEVRKEAENVKPVCDDHAIEVKTSGCIRRTASVGVWVPKCKAVVLLNHVSTWCNAVGVVS